VSVHKELTVILICYDGSDDARAAVSHAAALFPGQAATVITVWEPFIEVVAHTSLGFGMVAAAPDPEDIDQASRRRVEEIANEGAELAKETGMEATPRVCAQTSTTARALLGEAEKLDADAIVLGSRGLTGLRSLLLGSVSHELIQHADRTVVVVPSPAVAASRARRVREDEVGVG
jgi:nucleotide-binding universal stress UspA family protein